jgi:hypothetical protein
MTRNTTAAAPPPSPPSAPLPGRAFGLVLGSGQLGLGVCQLRGEVGEALAQRIGMASPLGNPSFSGA